MKAMRRILGALVMLAGTLGLVLSVAGLVMVWVAKPTVAAYAGTTIDTLEDTVVTSKTVMETTGEALGGDGRERGCTGGYAADHSCHSGGYEARSR